MTSLRHGAMILLACAVLVAGKASAQGRAPSPSRKSADQSESSILARRAAKLTELERWLGRLKGRFHIVGQIDQAWAGQPGRTIRPVRGVADCIGVGAGAGVQCLIDATWQPITWTIQPTLEVQPAMSEYFTLHPTVLLFGLDPDSVAIRLLQVDDHSIAIAGLGSPKQDVLVMKTKCGRSAWPVCEKVMRFTAKPGSDVVKLEIAIYGNAQWEILLHREPPEAVDRIIEHRTQVQ